jgi:transcriptional regulator with XRE-family HTH domain
MLDSEAMDQLGEVFLRQIDLLSPQQIRDLRLQSKLTQQELADASGVSEAAVARWEEGGQMQTRSLDNLLRLFFGMPQVRQILTEHKIGTLAPVLTGWE